MRRIITFVLAICVLSISAQAKTVAKETINGHTIKVTQSKGKTSVYWNGKKIRSYAFTGRVRIISEEKLTYNMLRKRNGKVLYIERIISKNNITMNGKYIVAPKGKTVITYNVYNPFTRWIDDIDERYDIYL